MVRGVALQAVAVAAVALTCATAVRCSLLLNEARGLTTRVCAQKERCADRHPSKVFTAPEDIYHATLVAYPCFCDENCHTYRDCCHDVTLNATHPDDEDTILGFPSAAWTCQFLFWLQVAHERTARFAWMVSRCPGEADAGMAEQCASLAPERTYIHDLPVIAGGVVFRNLYCAGCYGMTYNDLFPLNLEISCKAENVTSQDLVNATYVPGELKFVLTDNSTCVLEIRQFRNISNLNLSLKENNSPPVRLCRDGLIGWCPDDWKDEDVRLKCAEYLMIVQEMNDENRLFRNPHCAQCNNVSQMACGVFPKFGPHINVFDTPMVPTGSMSLIFHFSFGGSNVVGHEACSEGYVWDAIFQKCHPVFTCDAGAKFKSGLCPPDEEERDADSSLEQAGKNSTRECDQIVLRRDEFSLLENGSIVLNASLRQVEPGEFSQLDDGRVAVCADLVLGLMSEAQGGDTSFSPLEGTLSLICTIVSLVGLALHLVVLMAVPRMRNLPGLISMGISASLMAAQILFLIATSPARPAELVGCVALAAVLHFAFLSVFAWTAIMSFDIWRTFSHPTGNIGSRKSHTRKMQFLKYSAFACSMPLVIVSLAVALDVSGLDWALSPRYGQSSVCWFGSRLGLAVFFALPVLLVLLANLSLYTLVVLRIREQRKATKFVEERRHARYTESDCKLHFSIFNVMGGTWVLGLVAGLVDHPVLWIVFIVLNGSQGAIIFALQILKPRVLHMIRNRLAGREDSVAVSGSTGRTSASALLNRSSERSSAAISLAGGSVNLKRRVE